MARTGPRRTAVAVKLSDEGQAWIEAEAIRRGLLMPSGRPNRSEMVRLALAYAQLNMPKNWKAKT